MGSLGASWGPLEPPGAQEAPGGPRKLREAPGGSVSWSHLGQSWSPGNILGPSEAILDANGRSRRQLGKQMSSWTLVGLENTWLCGSGRMWSFPPSRAGKSTRRAHFFYLEYIHICLYGPCAVLRPVTNRSIVIFGQACRFFPFSLYRPELSASSRQNISIYKKHHGFQRLRS